MAMTRKVVAVGMADCWSQGRDVRVEEEGRLLHGPAGCLGRMKEMGSDWRSMDGWIDRLVRSDCLAGCLDAAHLTRVRRWLKAAAIFAGQYRGSAQWSPSVCLLLAIPNAKC